MRALLTAASWAAAAAAPLDATQAYIDTLEWPVNVVAPKMHFMAPSAGVAAPYCNLSLMEALERALYLDEVDEAPKPELLRLKRLFSFATELFDRLDEPKPGNGRVLPSVPVFQDPKAAPEAKARVLFTTMVLAMSVPDEMLKAMSSLDAEPDLEARAAILDELMKEQTTQKRWKRGIFSTFFEKTTSLGVDDDTYMDMIPDTMVGFLSSRVLTELLSEMITDAWGAGLVHDVHPTNLSAGICRAFTMGPKTDFLPETTICTLVTLLLSALSCSRDSALVDCQQRTATNYTFSQCDLIPEGWRTAAVTDLSFLPLDQAVDATARALTPAGREQEGPSLYALQLAQLNWSDATGQRWCQIPPDDPEFRAELIPGWKIVREIWLNQENSAAESNTSIKVSPFAALAKKSAPAHAARGAERAFAAGETTTTTSTEATTTTTTSTTALQTTEPTTGGGGDTTDPSTSPATSSSSSSAASITTSTSKTPEKKGSCEFLVVNRGTATGWEWFMNLSVAHTILPLLNEPAAKGHLGYANIAAAVLQPVIEHLTDEFESGSCVPEETTVWFSGHSLGGGQTNMQSLLLAGYWRQRGVPLKVNAFGEASMRLFNEHATKLHREWVNMRNLVFEYDFVPGMGCLGVGLPRCNPKFWRATIHGTGSDEPEQPLGGEIFLRGEADFTHARLLPGETTNITETLSFFDDRRLVFLPLGNTFAVIGMINDLYLNIPAPLQTGMAHICSYHCFTSRNFCSIHPALQTACVRAPINIDQPEHCMNKTMTRPDMAGTTNAKLSSLDCTPEFWGYNDLKPYNATNPDPAYCSGIIPGISAKNLDKIYKSFKKGRAAEL